LGAPEKISATLKDAVYSGLFTIAILRIATVAEEWFPYDRSDRHWVATIPEEWFPYDRSDCRWVVTMAEIELKSISLRSSRSLKSGFHMIPTIAELFFQGSQRL